MYDNTYSKTFFDFHWIGKKKTFLKELEVNGRTISSQGDLSHYITKFYANFYTSEAHVSDTSKAQKRCWESIPVRVMEAMNVDMTQTLTLEEVTEAIASLPKGKAPRHDGLPTEFFQEYAKEVAPMLLLAFKAMLSLGLTLDYINKGTITLIPKSGNHSKLGNWRPITLLGSIYKIPAKTVLRRIQAHLPFVIRPNQIGFVEGRSILDNNFLAQEALEGAVESGQDLVFLLFDFEKTFDRIEWGFLFPVLSKLGFSPKWIEWVSSLYWLASSSIKVNGESGEDFRLVRSVKQGYPLALYLFIFTTDVLGHMLDDPNHEVEGPSLPKGGCVRDQIFVDDTTLYLKGTQSDLSKVWLVLDLFCCTSRAKGN
jgi:hypothetical protein